ncbi:MAG: NAD(P)-binding protein [Gammaproteobacteria bacterium]|nr:NAD(P)-binding protein [Gammaproteobacteria bacterium]
MTRVAVIGAGLSGLVAARELHKCSDVTVFEKSRGFGGRMATRYGTEFEFDHGAQFFVARSKRFQKFLEPLIVQGTVACWHARFVELQRDKITATRDWDDDFPHYVGAPRMSAIGRYLADGLTIRQNTTVANIAREASGWRLADNEGNELGCFDWVVCALPAAQTAALVPDDSLLYRRAATTKMRACYALMLGFDKPLSLPWQAARVLDADISWISVNSSKPKRPDDFTLVVHSTNKYADANIDRPIPQVQEHLLAELSAVIGTDCSHATFCQLHRWRYANIDKQPGPACLVDTTMQLAGCGDWFKAGRVEAAFTSGNEVASKVPSQQGAGH